MKPLWETTVDFEPFAPLDKDISTDVLVIGGGIAGLITAFMLKNAGIDVVVVEADRICSGVTKNTTAKVTYQHGLIYKKLADRYGINAAKLYLEANKTALFTYAELCKNIDCDFKFCDSYVYSKTDLKKINEEAAVLKKLGIDCEVVDTLNIPVSIKGAVKVKEQAQFNPLKFLKCIVSDLKIYENTRVLEVFDGGAKTNRGNIKTKRIVVATHFPFLNKHGLYFLKMYQHRSYVIAVKNAKNVGGMYVDEQSDGLSFRNYGDLLLLGGGGHRTGKSGGGWIELEYIARKNYKGCSPVYKWATQDCMTLDGIPYVGKYSALTPNLYVITGFNKWGMTSAMAGATVLCDMLNGKKSPFENLFSPSRSMLHKQLALNIGESTLGLICPTVPRCPHLGCALKYNPQEHSWDCACHGSRFSVNGKLLNGPATNDKEM